MLFQNFDVVQHVKQRNAREYYALYPDSMVCSVTDGVQLLKEKCAPAVTTVFVRMAPVAQGSALAFQGGLDRFVISRVSACMGYACPPVHAGANTVGVGRGAIGSALADSGRLVVLIQD